MTPKLEQEIYQDKRGQRKSKVFLIGGYEEYNMYLKKIKPLKTEMKLWN